MTTAEQMTSFWRNIEVSTTSANPGFQFTGNSVPTTGVSIGYELSLETVLATAGQVEWMHDPATGLLYPYAEQAFRDLTAAIASRGLAGDDEVVGSDLADIFKTGSGNDIVFARDGNDYLDGGDGNDVLHGQSGNDVIVGGSGVDQMFGGEGDDAYYVDNSQDRIVEGSGAGYDVAYASTSYALGADVWVEHLATTNRNGADAIDLIGNEYGQLIEGNAGSNRLTGGGGDDVLDGGAGHDEAVYTGFRKEYVIQGGGTSHMVVASTEGTDTLVSIEQLTFSDGRLVFDLSDPFASAYRLYQAAFDRTPDMLGLNYWAKFLQHDAALSDIGSAFAGSAEFQEKYGTLSDDSFVRQLYQNVLDRTGDADGVAYWSGLLTGGAITRGQVLTGFAESAENIARTKPVVEMGLWDADEQATSVARLYAAALDRLPDAGGLAFWIGTAKSGASLTNIADSFVASAELQTKYGTLSNSQYVEQLYHNVLNRAGDPEGLAYWLGHLDDGSQDRGDVLLAFSDSLEHQYKTEAWLQDGLMLA